MAQVIQVEIRTGSTHTVTWLDAALKPKAGMALVCKGDLCLWTVVHAYPITTRNVGDNNGGWEAHIKPTERSAESASIACSFSPFDRPPDRPAMSRPKSNLMPRE